MKLSEIPLVQTVLLTAVSSLANVFSYGSLLWWLDLAQPGLEDIIKGRRFF